MGGIEAGGLTVAQFVASMGIGGVLAYAMFHIYRKDIMAMTALWQQESDSFKDIVIANTKAITELTSKLDSPICPLSRLDCPNFKPREE